MPWVIVLGSWCRPWFALLTTKGSKRRGHANFYCLYRRFQSIIVMAAGCLRAGGETHMAQTSVHVSVPGDGKPVRVVVNSQPPVPADGIRLVTIKNLSDKNTVKITGKNEIYPDGTTQQIWQINESVSIECHKAGGSTILCTVDEPFSGNLDPPLEPYTGSARIERSAVLVQNQSENIALKANVHFTLKNTGIYKLQIDGQDILPQSKWVKTYSTRDTIQVYCPIRDDEKYDPLYTKFEFTTAYSVL